MPVEAGTNRINWNLRCDSPPAFTHNYAQVMGAVLGDTPASPEGPLVPPGIYTLKLTVDRKAYTQPVTVKNDPRSPATAMDLRAQHALQTKLYRGIGEAWDGYQQVAAMRSRLAELQRSNPVAAVADAVKAFDAKLTALAGTIGGGRRGGGGGGFPGAGGPPPAPNFVGVNAALIRQLDTLDFGDMAPNEPMQKAYVAGCTELKTAVTTWADLNAKDLAALNTVLEQNKLAPLTPTRVQQIPASRCAPLPSRLP